MMRLSLKGLRLWLAVIACGAGGIVWHGRGQSPDPAPVRFAHHVIDKDGPLDPWLKSVGDIDGDGKLDLLAGGHGGGGLVWYRGPGWTKHVTATEASFGTDGEIADMDGDGDADVIAITNKPAALSWYENPGWKRHPIAELRLHDVEVCDFDRDGDVDLIARDQGSFGAKGDLLHFFRQDPGGKWTNSTITVTSGEGIRMEDIDGDGDLDIVIERVWYENTGDPNTRPWPAHEYGGAWDYPFTFVATARINGDRRPDIVLAPAERANTWYRLSWFESPANPKSKKWREHVVDARVEAVHHFVGAADFNGDGRTDIAAAEMKQGVDPDEVKIYLNPAEARPGARPSFRQTVPTACASPTSTAMAIWTSTAPTGAARTPSSGGRTSCVRLVRFRQVAALHHESKQSRDRA